MYVSSDSNADPGLGSSNASSLSILSCSWFEFVANFLKLNPPLLSTSLDSLYNVYTLGLHLQHHRLYRQHKSPVTISVSSVEELTSVFLDDGEL